MVVLDRWSRVARKFIVFQKVVRIFRARMGGYEIPAGSGSGCFQAKPGSKMLLQIFVILSPPCSLLSNLMLGVPLVVISLIAGAM